MLTTNILPAIEDLRTILKSNVIRSCRLVQYCGPEFVGAKDVTLPTVEMEVKDLREEGFFVSWLEQDHRLLLRVWEFGGVEPSWADVLAERDLEDLGDFKRG